MIDGTILVDLPQSTKPILDGRSPVPVAVRWRIALGSYHGRHATGLRHLAAEVPPGRHNQPLSGCRRARPGRRPARRLLLVLGCTTALVALLATIPRATGTSTTVQFSATADAFVSQARPNRNFGTNPVLRTDASPTLERIYLRFDVRPLSGVVTRATLRLYANGHDRVGFTVRSTTTDWTEEGITYTNAPVPGALAGRSGPSAPGSWTSVDVTSLVAGEGMTSFALTTSNASAGRYASRERGAAAPQLVVETTAAATIRAAATSRATTSVSTTRAAATTTPPTTRPVPTRTSSSQPAAAAKPHYNKIVGFFIDKGEHSRLCDGSTPGDKYAYIVVQWATTRQACGMMQWRRKYPHAKILAYQNFGAMIAGPHHDKRPSTLVTQEEAAAQESWWLHNSAGKRITFSDYSYLAAANIGDPGWQAQARAHVGRIKADGYDGILLDDVNLYPGHGLSATEANHSVEYRTDTAYGDASRSVMAVLGPYIKTHGLLAFANVGMDPWIKDQYSRFRSMLANLDGVCREFWMAWGGGGGVPFTGPAWSSTLRVQVDTEAAGRAFLANSYPLAPQDDIRSVRYGQASFWIGWDGEAASGFGYVSGLRAYKQYGRVLGVPTGPKQAVGVGWMRRYTAGIAVVNPHPSASQTFSLGRTYKDEDGASRSTVSLGPASGMILHT
jgi:hypothetical protein